MELNQTENLMVSADVAEVLRELAQGGITKFGAETFAAGISSASKENPEGPEKNEYAQRLFWAGHSVGLAALTNAPALPKGKKARD